MEASVPHGVAPVTFRDPPVIEVALGVQFEGRITDDARTLGDFWPRIRDEYPVLEHHPALPPQIEEFGAALPVPSFQITSEPPATRYWFLGADGDRVVQLQPDRLLFNWRKTGPDAEYPRYHELRPQFQQHLETLLGLLGQDEAVTPTWCEVNYVNHVAGASEGAPRPGLHEVLTLVNAPETVRTELEDQSLAQRYLIRDGGEPAGRLHLSAGPHVRLVDGAELNVISLAVRLPPTAPTVEGVLATLDFSRELIVQTFRDVTRPSMHERWRLES